MCDLQRSLKWTDYTNRLRAHYSGTCPWKRWRRTYWSDTNVHPAYHLEKDEWLRNHLDNLEPKERSLRIMEINKSMIEDSKRNRRAFFNGGCLPHTTKTEERQYRWKEFCKRGHDLDVTRKQYGIYKQNKCSACVHLRDRLK